MEQYEIRVAWLKLKHEQLLQMMRKHEIEMWIIPEEIFDRDPLTHYVAPTRAFSHGVTHVFVDGRNEGLKRFSTYIHPNTEYTDFFERIHDHFGEPDDEVSVTGRPLGTWIQSLPEWREVDYKHLRAKPGDYIVKLIVNGNEYSTKAVVLKDQWFDKMY